MLSIDVGSQKVCIVEGAYKKGRVTVSSCGEIAYKSEVIAGGEIKDRATLSFLINEIIKTNNMKSKSAVLTINSSDIIIRDLKLPDVKLPQLQQLVKNEIAKITDSEKNFVVDFTVWDRTDDQMLRVMAYAMAQELVADYYNILRECKLKPRALDVHANAIRKLCTYTKMAANDDENPNMMLVDIGFSKINFHGFSGGKCIFNRSELSPVQGFVHDFMALQHTDDSIEALKSLDLSPDFAYEDPAVGEACRYMLSRLTDEMQKYNQYILIHSSDKFMPKLYLCGGIVSVKNMDLALAERLKQPVEVLAAIENVVLPRDCVLSKACNAVGALIRTR